MTQAGQAMPVDNGSRRRGLVLILVVFVLGLVCGSALTVIGVRTVLDEGGPRPVGLPPDPGERRTERIIERMRRELGLTPEQSEQIREVMRRTGGEMRAMVEASRREIRSILTEEQREKFDEMRPRFGGGRRGRRPGGGPRRGPGPGPGPGLEPEAPPPPPPPDEE